MMPLVDLVGMKFGRLTVLSRDNDIVSKSGYRTVTWKCRCDCGNVVTVRGKCLSSGGTKSCGCLQRELLSMRASVHSGYGTRLYAIWDSMRQRCNNPKNNAFKNYGGRGIKICLEWDDFSRFREWAYEEGYNDLAERGSYTLDRIDVDKGYSPENCRWANMVKQANNKRNTIKLTFKNEEHSLSEWSKILGVKYCTLWKRYSKGLSTEEILK